MKLRILPVLLIAAAFSGCTYYLRPGDLSPAVTQVPHDQRHAIWERALSVLLDEGYVPDVLNESAAYISAKFRDDVSIGALTGTTAIVMISPDDNLRVEVSGHGQYTSSNQLVADLSAIQTRLTREILAPPGTPIGPARGGSPQPSGSPAAPSVTPPAPPVNPPAPPAS